MSATWQNHIALEPPDRVKTACAPPRGRSRSHVQYANTLLKDRVLFGSDYPLITPERWMKDFDEAGFKDKVKPLILKENAKRLLGFS
jgi:predicted TIM-barrel fold metal-dependent hydrolase